MEKVADMEGIRIWKVDKGTEVTKGTKGTKRTKGTKKTKGSKGTRCGTLPDLERQPAKEGNRM